MVKDPEEIGCKGFGRLSSAKGHIREIDVCPGPECSAFLECLEEILWYVDRKLAGIGSSKRECSKINKEEISRRISELLSDFEQFSIHGPLKFAEDDISGVAELKEAMAQETPDGVILFNSKGDAVAYNVLGMKFYRNACLCHRDLVDKSCPIHKNLQHIFSGDAQVILQVLSGKKRIYEVKFSKVPFSILGDDGAVMSIRDVTGIKSKP